MLALQEIEKIYFTDEHAVRAVTDISLTVEDGEFVSFIGPSGCGKTTLLSMIAGLLDPTSGTIFMNDRKLEGYSKETGYMLQQDYLFPWLTIRQNVELGLVITGMLTSETSSKTMELLRQLGLGDKADAFPSELSGGMRQRAALVRMLAPEPSLLLLDEPFSALDYQTKLRLEDLVSITLKQQRKTAVLVTHDLSEAIAMSDRIVLFESNPGTIRHTFNVPEELRTRSPFETRNHPSFHSYFQKIWEELENVETQHQDST
ncbi:ABC transporter ATP-binding protein [Salibacterium halotolerans]|uniref:NitT/TauT family transport system ATP-binding protein n=1 Tax=Salibacterium halotolerans TaxID=1884432 RepID=A0A1I5R3R6_9BACI|nr:ABC transporter ATP-binding protein [Salibacterium halotolerans]SFP53158.1 NitT/TauT family transport system ATP-binding protein [Salibacterium halotolerans]